MHQLSGLDATFLYLETPEMPMHVGALHVLELPAGFRGRFVTALRAHLKTRLPLAPVLRRRLWWMPLNLANPAWVDAEPDLREHVVEIKLPRGAGQAQLEAEVGRLHPVLLDRKRPLWKMHVFEGLAPSPEGRRRVGLYTQLHHAAVDGQAAVALANLLLDVTPEPRRIPLKTSKRQKTFELGMVEMLRGALGAQAMKVAQIVRELPSTVGTLKNAAVGVATRSALFGGKGGPSNLALAPRTPLNVSVTPQRAFAALSLPMADVRALAHALDATVNDLVLMLCSSALRRYYARRKALPRKSLIAAVPISLRQAGDDAPDNQASMSLVSLGTHIADPMKRLQHIVAATKAMKATMGSLKSVLPTDYPSLGIPWLIEAATALYGKAKVADRIPQVANVVISNVPGPAQPLYLAGALMLSNWPTSIVVHGLALNITVQSQGGRLDFGLMADGVAMPDVRELADAVGIAFDDLRVLQGVPVDEDAPGLVGLATRGLTGAFGQAVGLATGTAGKLAQQAMDTAVRSAVAQVTRAPRARPAARRKPAR
ncbi:MAG: wax ester/triacylglycerol synthase family O-acyltransferase [Burkholderiaceae bacterium]|nr:wax ester/triacylglycerol synthase family O-acyltransferase [Burkholderiaceae bacterium]